MQHSLTTATPFKSQKILFKARALGSNLIHRRLSTSQLPILDPPSPVTWFTSFFSCPTTPYGLPPPSFARFCDTRISSKNHKLVVIYNTNKILYCLKNSFTLTTAPNICIIVPYFSYYISFITVIPVILTNQFTPVIPGHPSHPSHSSHPSNLSYP